MNKLSDFIKEANKTLGNNVAICIDEGYKIEVDTIPTGIENIDTATGIGGIPMGKFTEVFGAEGSGKTTLCLHTIAQAQKMGLNCAFVDTEHAISFDRMKRLGINVGELLFSQPDSGEEALNLVELMVRDGRFGLIVIDSVAALVPMAEVEKDMGDSVMGVHAKLMSQAMRKLTAPTNKSNTAVMFVNQTRSKIGVMWGNPEVTTGGVALKFYSSLRIRMAYTGKVKDKAGNQISSKGKATIVKNKLAIPFKEANFEIDKDGINCDSSYIENLINKGILTKTGGWIKLGDEVIGQGIKGVSENIKQDKDLKDRIEKELHKY